MHAPSRFVATAFATLLAALALSPLSASGAEEPKPDGVNAVVNMATYVMTHPARFGETPTMVAARADLVAELEDRGLEVIEHRYNAGGQMGTNIIGLVRGTERPHDWLTVTAHYDTVAMVGAGGGFLQTVYGAWDDGAGVAAALELARVAKDRPWKNTVAFVFFDDEEIGLVGSGRFVNEWNGRVWEGAPVRLVGNLNMDPPGLNWPCGVEQGVSYPVAFMQYDTGGQGSALLRSFMVAEKDAAGVPEWAFRFYGGSLPAFLVLGGTSDHARFGARGIPNMYIGSSVHIALGAPEGESIDVPFMYPLHTPADSLSTMLTYCPNLHEGFQVALDIVWGAMLRVDAYPGAFPTP